MVTTAQPSAETTPQSRIFAHGAIVACVALLLYSPSLLFGFTGLDDNNLILERERFLSHPSSLYRVFTQPFFGTPSGRYYRPLVNLTYAINAWCGGVHPLGYHLANSMLHAISCLLLLALLRRLHVGAWPSFFAALLFAVHPAATAAVAWIPGRSDTLFVVFTLGAALLLLRSVRDPSAGVKAGHVLCFLCALFSKETAVVLPLLFAVLLRAGGEKSGGLFSRFRWMPAGWAGALAVYGAARIPVVSTTPGAVVAQVVMVPRRLPELLAGIGKLLLPLRLQVVASSADLLRWPGMIAVVLLAGMFFLRGTRRNVLAAGLVFLMAPLLMSLLSVRSVVLENRYYLSLAGVAVLAGELLRAVRTKGRSSAAVSTAVAVVACAGLATVTVRYARNFRDRDTFSLAAVTDSPHSSVAAHLRFRASYRSGRHVPDLKGCGADRREEEITTK